MASMHILTLRLYTIHAVLPIFLLLMLINLIWSIFIHYFTIFDFSRVNHFNGWVLRKLGQCLYVLQFVDIIIILLIFLKFLVSFFGGTYVLLWKSKWVSGTNSAHKCQPPRAKRCQFHCDRFSSRIRSANDLVNFHEHTKKQLPPKIVVDDVSSFIVFLRFLSSSSSSSLPSTDAAQCLITCVRYNRIFYRLITPTYRIKWSKNPIRTWKCSCSTM